MSGFLPGNSLIAPVVPFGFSASVKAGDTLTNPTTETFFATQPPIPANSLSVGDLLLVDFIGRYMIPGGALGPTARAKAYIGNALVADSGTLTVGLGTGVAYVFTGRLYLTVMSLGTNATLDCLGWMSFQTQSGATPSAASEGVDMGLVTFDSTVRNLFRMSTTTSNVSGQTFTLRQLPLQRLPALPTNT